jgi:hypothetical protein
VGLGLNTLPSFMCRLSRKSWSLIFWGPNEPIEAFTAPSWKCKGEILVESAELGSLFGIRWHTAVVYVRVLYKFISTEHVHDI